jgi:hypothetical protein
VTPRNTTTGGVLEAMVLPAPLAAASADMESARQNRGPQRGSRVGVEKRGDWLPNPAKARLKPDPTRTRAER